MTLVSEPAGIMLLDVICSRGNEMDCPGGDRVEPTTFRSDRWPTSYQDCSTPLSNFDLIKVIYFLSSLSSIVIVTKKLIF